MATKILKRPCERLKIDWNKACDRAKKSLAVLTRNYPGARVALDYTNALELLIATILGGYALWWRKERGGSRLRCIANALGLLFVVILDRRKGGPQEGRKQSLFILISGVPHSLAFTTFPT